ncbi:MAG: DUF4876 domain-containing protein [Candidatus Marinimicrobia bacterium]|nr:DUF4876 domain-containing protein [Candidatus Neomarinimicrobiota bacterium]
MRNINLQNILILFFSFILIIGCLNNQNIPSTYDGKMDITLQAWFDIDSLNDEVRLSSIPVEIFTYAYEGCSYTNSTDSNGIVIFENLPWSEYNININSEIFVNYGTFIDTMPIAATGIYNPDSSANILDTLNILCGGSEKGLKINELYTTAPPNNFFYCSDDYFELYNSSKDIVYLDGMMFVRIYKMLAWASSIFQFPGEPLTGRRYPVQPNSFVIVAKDAYDHRTIVSSSIDLSNADWEFRNSADYGDWDNPDVPNLENIEIGCHTDFGIGLTADVILITDGSDINYLDGIDSASVVDGVEYCGWTNHTKCIEKYIDRGWGGVGLQKYSGQSLERIAPGFDTNNSTVDFEIISAPTIGYQHE